MTAKGYKIANYIYDAIFISLSMFLLWLIPYPLKDRLIAEFVLILFNLWLLHLLHEDQFGSTKIPILLGVLVLGIIVLMLAMRIDNTWLQVFSYLISGDGSKAWEQVGHVNGNVFILCGVCLIYAACVAIVRRIFLTLLDRY